jgi:hypothetical protein
MLAVRDLKRTLDGSVDDVAREDAVIAHARRSS